MPDLTELRLRRPEAIAEAAAARERPAGPPRTIVAADHPARASLLRIELEDPATASALPAWILGGAGDAAFAEWERALALPTVQGLVVGRSLLYPHDDDVAAAVDTAASLTGALA